MQNENTSFELRFKMPKQKHKYEYKIQSLAVPTKVSMEIPAGE